jgi:hypothetical protein
VTRTGQFSDRGHYGRKAVLWTVRLVLLVPVLLIAGANWLAMRVERWMGGLDVWAHPCLYIQRGETYEQFTERTAYDRQHRPGNRPG